MASYRKWEAFDIPIVNVFGLTESGCTSVLYRAEGPQPYTEYLPNGRPLSNTQIYVLDAHAQPVPEQVEGELYIGGASVGLGYVGETALTSEHFIHNPVGSGLVYKTGDRARWLPGGQLEFIGRHDHQVKVRGFRVELDEIESQCRHHPEVKEAVVVLSLIHI